jgi:putative endopeptidase
MVRWLSFLAASTALAGCTATQTTEVAAPVAPSEVMQPEPAPAPKPTYGTFGFDEAGMDKAIQPGDNFYLYANGSWAKDTPIPADKTNYGAYKLIQENTQAKNRSNNDEAAKEPTTKYA